MFNRDDRSYAARKPHLLWSTIWIPPNPNEAEDEGEFRGGGFIAMYWYKHRGQTENIIRVDPRNGAMIDVAALPLTAVEAEIALVNLDIRFPKVLQSYVARNSH